MRRKSLVEQLAMALQDCGRELREFTPAALSRNAQASHALLNLLGDPAQLSDEGYRLQLATDLSAVVRLIVDRIPDHTLRRVTEVSLALDPCFHGTLVSQRKRKLSESEGISADVFRDRRRDGLWEVAIELVRAFPGGWRRRPVVCIAGDYDDPRFESVAQALGRGLAPLGVAVVSGFARAGQQVSLAMVNALEDMGIVVDSERVTQYARTAKARVYPKGLIGRLVAYGETQEQKRHQMLSECDVVVLFAGADGTAAEARMARSRRIPVLPLICTGGTARSYGEAKLAAAKPIILGGHPVDPTFYAQLGHGRHEVAIETLLALIKQVITASPAENLDVAHP